MIAQGKRKLRSGLEFDALIPKALGVVTQQRKWRGSHDSVQGVIRYARKYTDQTAQLAQTLRGTTLRETCQNIWNFIYRHIQYQNDADGFEQIRSPSRSWSERKTGVDCDDYSIITSSILLNLRIPHVLRMTDYGTGRGWQHIYVIVPKSGKLGPVLDQSRRSEYTVIDAVTDAFDDEKRYAKKEDFNMDIQFLNGLDGVPDYGVDGLGKTFFGKVFQKVGNVAKGAANVVKKAATTPIRLGILAIMKLNIRQGAKRLRWGYLPYGAAVAKANYGPKNHEQIVNSLKKLISIFKGLGGDSNVLRTTILNGAGNKDGAVPKDSNQAGLGSLLQQDPDWLALQQITSVNSVISGVAGLEGLSGDGLGLLAETIIASATAVIIPVLNMLGKAKENDPNDPVPDEYAPADDGSADLQATSDAQPADPTTDEAGATSGLGATRQALKKKVVKPVVQASRTNPAAGKKKLSQVKQTTAKKPVVKKTAPSSAIVTPAIVNPVVSNSTSTSFALPASLPPDAATVATKAAMVNQVIAKKKGKINPKSIAKGVTSVVSKLIPKKKAKAVKPVAPKPTAAAVVVPRHNDLDTGNDTAVNLPDVQVSDSNSADNPGIMVPRKRNVAAPTPQQPAANQDMIDKVLDKTGKVSTVVRNVATVARSAQQVYKAPTTTLPVPSDDEGGIIDKTAETAAQARLDPSSPPPGPEMV